jgi:Homeodomain-like domain
VVETSKRFAGLKLTKKDRAELSIRKSKGKQMSVRIWRRIRVLELLDEGLSVRMTAKAVGAYPREVSRVGKRYLAGGLEVALTDEARGKPEKKLDSTQEAAVIAMVCGPPPPGRARWTVRLVTEHVVTRGIAARVGRETIRIVLATHELKPWREKNVVRAADRSGVRRSNGERTPRLRPTS